MRWFLVLMVLCGASAALADDQIFHGWSKDGSWLVFEEHGENDVTELFFCQTDAEAKPSWPKVLEEETLEEVGRMQCVRFIDPNKAPYQWKKKLVLPQPSIKFKTIVVADELVRDGEEPGFVLVNGDKKQTCYVSGLQEDSKLQHVWFHPTGRWAAAQVDGKLSYCAVTLKPGKAGKRR